MTRKILDSLPGEKGIRAKYPVEEWADGKPGSIQRGVDFTCTVGTMRSVLCRYAGSHGKYVTTRMVDADTLAFQFFTPTGT